MNILKAVGEVDFTKYALLPISQYVYLEENWLSSICCKICQKYFFFGIKILHAHLKYVCNIPTKYQMNILKALGGVDFTKYALFTH